MSKPYDRYKEDIVNIFKDGDTFRSVARKLKELRSEELQHKTECSLKDWVIKVLREEYSDKDLQEMNVGLRKKSQKYQDLNRIERKAYRESDRVDNALTSFFSEIRLILKNHPMPIRKQGRVSVPKNGNAGILQLADLHFNELVNLSHNRYDFSVAAKRLKYFADKAIGYFKHANVTDIIIANTGDNMNSDRRLDELLSQSTNRARATSLGFYLLKQMVSHLSEYFRINIVSVTGNESRVGKERGYSEDLATDSYDVIINEFLGVHFHDDKRVQVHKTESMENVVSFNGLNILVLHGESLKPNSNIQKQIQQIVGKYALRGIIIHYVISGHHHFSMLGDFFGQSSSLVGANGYSEYGLGFASMAAQNIYILNESDIDSIKIALQNADKYTEGYDVIKDLEAYNAKSVDKLKQQETVFKIVI